MKLRKTTLLLLLPTFFSPALVQASGYCRSISSISKNVDSCEDNEYYSEAAVLCLEKLEAEIKKASVPLKTGLTTQNKATEKAQSKTFNKAGSSYQITEKLLDALIQMAEASAKEVDSYLDNIILPEDFDNEEIVNNNPDQFLADAECYSDSSNVIRSVLMDFYEHLTELKAARGDTSQLESASKDKESKVKALPHLTNSVNHGVGSSATGVNGEEVNPQSGISDSSLKKK